MVFRGIYGTEIENVSRASIEDDFKRQLDIARRQAARYRGAAAEYRVRYRLQVASLAGATLGDIVIGEVPPNLDLDRFTTIRKAHFHLDQEVAVEIDLHAVSESDDGTDLMVEVKDWQREVTPDKIRRFIQVKEALAGHLVRKTAFLFYSEGGLREEAAATLAEAGILVVDANKLAGFEMPPGTP